MENIIEYAKQLEGAKKTLDITYAENQRLTLNNLQVTEETKTRETYLADLNGRIEKAQKVLEDLEISQQSIRSSVLVITNELEAMQTQTNHINSEKLGLEETIKIKREELKTEIERVGILATEIEEKQKILTERENKLAEKEQRIKQFIKEIE